MSIQSLIKTGTKVWLDSIDPADLVRYQPLGITGATSNPIIIADILKTGEFDSHIAELMSKDHDDAAIAWKLTDQLVRTAQAKFLPVWERTDGDDGYVSFELDPLLEDAEGAPVHAERVKRYVELGRQWSDKQRNRMIKVPATPAGLDALEELAAAGVTLNVTLIFSARQYEVARDNIWRGAQRRRDGLKDFKSVYSIFISRLDVYTQKQVPQLSAAAQGQVGIFNAKLLWRMNQQFFADKKLRLRQEMIFASTGTKNPSDPKDKYVAATAGSDIQTNPPATLQAVEEPGKTYSREVDRMPPDAVIKEIHKKVDMDQLEQTLMREGTAKFADPMKSLLKQIAKMR